MVYTECQAILFGVKTYLDSPEHREMLLNPEDNYVIKADDLCVYMCESPRELNDVNALVNSLLSHLCDVTDIPVFLLECKICSRKN